MLIGMRERAGKRFLFLVCVGAVASGFVACGLDDTVIETASVVDASSSGGDTSTQSNDADVVTVYDSGGDATIGTTICTSLTLCDDGGTCGGGTTCMPPIPTGWSLVGFDPAASVSCGAAYATHDSFVVVDGGSASCVCSCTAGTPPSCTNLQAVLTTGAACAASPSTQNISGTCQGLSGAGFTPTNAGAIEAHLQPFPDTCTSSVSKTLSSWDAGAARACDFGGDGGEFCAGHDTCVASSGAPHSICIEQAYSGSVPPTCISSCPSGFTASCRALSDTATDTRDCSACSCAWSNNGCTSPTVTLSGAGNCGGTTTAISPDTCASTTIPTIGSIGVSGIAATPACAKATDTAAIGAVTASPARVVCCAN